MSLRDKLYYLLIEKNSLIANEYWRYTERCHELGTYNKAVSWFQLIRLNFHYRIFRRKKPLLKLPKHSKSYYYGMESYADHRRTPEEFAQKLLEYEVVSFDIFDTLILRPLAKPSDLFALVGEKLHITNFRALRCSAERKAKTLHQERTGIRDVTINDIYDVIADYAGIDAEEGIKAEFETEMDLCFANPYIKQAFKILKARNKRIIAVSDMYIPRTMMEKLLEKCGYTGFEKVFVSCEYGCNKRSGELYDRVSTDLGGAKWIHVGDNGASDVHSAHTHGIEAYQYRNCHELGNAFRPENMSDLTYSAYAGIVNTTLHNGTEQHTPFYEYGFVCGGLYVLGYASWIHRQAMQRGITKILFLSRDGKIYKKIFDMLYPDMESEYVYWSRIAGVKSVIPRCRNDFLIRMVDHKTVSIIETKISSELEMLGISDLEPLLKDYRLRADDVITADNADSLKRFFIDNFSTLEERAAPASEQYKAAFAQYVKGHKKVAVVDVGWAGSGPLNLKQLIEEEWQLGCEVTGFVAGCRDADSSSVLSALANGRLCSYIFSPRKNFEHCDFHGHSNSGCNSIFFELFTQAKHPSFFGVTGDGEYRFDIPEVENYTKIDEIHRGIYDFCEKYSKAFEKYPYLLDISGYDAYCPFRGVAEHPEFYRRAFGDFSFSRGVGGDKSIQRLETINEILDAVNL